MEADRKEALAGAAGSAPHVVEEWRCNACAKSHPCIVQIHYEPGFADRHVGHTRFVLRTCVAGETHFPEWRPEPLRVLSPNSEVSHCQKPPQSHDSTIQADGPR